jgi:hypothetical protein
MIRLIGIQRILAIVLLAALVVLLFLYTKFLMEPGIRITQAELSKNRGEIAEMRDNIDKLMQGMQLFQTQKDDFLYIESLGFFDDQNRVEARRRLNLMREESDLLSAKYTIKQARSIDNEQATEAGYKILNTEIDFTFEALDDGDIYNFIYLLNYGFPGLITIEKLTMAREKEITQPLLRKIGNGEYEPLVRGALKVSWITMVPDSAVETRGETQ